MKHQIFIVIFFYLFHTQEASIASIRSEAKMCTTATNVVECIGNKAYQLKDLVTVEVAKSAEEFARLITLDNRKRDKSQKEENKNEIGVNDNDYNEFLATIKKYHQKGATLMEDKIILFQTTKYSQNGQLNFDFFHELCHNVIGDGGVNNNLNTKNINLLETVTNYIAVSYSKSHKDQIDISSMEQIYPEFTSCFEKLMMYLGDETVGEMIYGTTNTVIPEVKEGVMEGEIILLEKLSHFLSKNALKLKIPINENIKDFHFRIKDSICNLFNKPGLNFPKKVFDKLKYNVIGKIEIAKHLGKP